MDDLKQGVFPSMMTHSFSNDDSRPFWDASLEGKLSAPKCTSCGTFRLPPAPFCFNCQKREVEWVELSGKGTVFSFTIVRHPLSPELAACVPYAAGVIELDGTQGAGARLICNIVDCDVETLRIGDKVEVVWEPHEEMAVPRFRPVKP